MSFKIFTDTSCNIPLKTLEESNIGIIPFTYYPKDGSNQELSCLAIENFDGKKYYDEIRSGKLYNTSQINPQTFYDAIEPFAKEGNDILYIGMSSGISGAYNSSLMAKNMLEENFPERKFLMLDTKAASLGEGLAVFKAVELQNQGLSLDDCYSKLEAFCKCIYQVFTVDNLTHLQRTGRLSNAAAFIGKVLNIKPLLRGNENGQIINFAKIRGSKKAIASIADIYDKLVVDAATQTVCIAESDAPEDTDLLIELLNKNNPPKEILRVCYEPVTGAHVGPGTVALFFLSDENCRFKE